MTALTPIFDPSGFLPLPPSLSLFRYLSLHPPPTQPHFSPQNPPPRLALLVALRPLYNVLNTSFAAAMVASISASVCAKDMNPASYWEGARYTPCSSIPRCHFANLA